MKTYYKTIPEWENPEDYIESKIDININNPNTLEEKWETIYFKK